MRCGLIASPYRQKGNESAPKITINNTINLFFLNCNQHLGNLNNSFRVLFDKIVSVWPVPGTSTVSIVSAHFRSLKVVRRVVGTMRSADDAERRRRRDLKLQQHKLPVSLKAHRTF